jgi:hypothetical protein
MVKKAEPLVRLVKMIQPPRNPKNSRKAGKKHEKEHKINLKIPVPKTHIVKDNMIHTVNVSILLSCGSNKCRDVDVIQLE